MKCAVFFLLFFISIFSLIYSQQFNLTQTSKVLNYTVYAEGLTTFKSNEGTYLGVRNANTVDLFQGGGQIIWQQDFTKFKNVSSTGWNIQNIPQRKYNNQIQRYDQTGIQFSNQGMIIYTHFNKNNKVVSGKVNTLKRLSVKYGYIQAQMKFQKGNGLWSAFSILGDDSQVWPDCGQIDIMQRIGILQNTIFGNLHGPGYSGYKSIVRKRIKKSNASPSLNATEEICYGSQTNNDKDVVENSANIIKRSLSEEWHKYAIHWQPNKIQWYIDNILYFTATPESLNRNRPGAKWAFNDKHFYFTLNQGFGGSIANSDPNNQNHILNKLRTYETRNFTIKSITISKSVNNYGQVSGSLAQASQQQQKITSIDLQWHWYYIGKDQFILQSEKYKTFLATNNNVDLVLLSNPSKNQAWIKQYKAGYSNWKSYKTLLYLMVNSKKIGLSKAADQKQKWNDQIQNVKILSDYNVFSHGVTFRKSFHQGVYLRASDKNSVDLIKKSKKQLIWSQDFTQVNNLNQLGWNVQTYPPRWFNNQIQQYDYTGVEFSDQGVIMHTHLDKDNKTISGRINTKNKLRVKYGYIQAQIKFDEGIGLWPGFWMLGNDGQDWPNCGQINIVQWVGRLPNSIFGTIHGPWYSGGDSFGSSSNNDDPNLSKKRSADILGKKLFGQWHKVAINWQQNKIEWFFDGILYFTATPQKLNSFRPGANWVFNDRYFYFILNQAYGGTFGNTDPSNQTPEIESLQKYRSRNFTIRSITISKTESNQGQIIGSLSGLKQLQNNGQGKQIMWHWHYIGIYNGTVQFLWQSEKYNTFLSGNENGTLYLAAFPGKNQIWIKQDKIEFRNWRSSEFNLYLSASENLQLNLQKNNLNDDQKWYD